MIMTAVAISVVLAFVWVKQERAGICPESVDAATAEMARKVVELGVERSVIQRILLSYGSVLGSVGDMKARGPALLREVTGLAESASGGISVGFYVIKCATGWDFYGRLWGGIFTVPFLLSLTALYTLCRSFRKPENERFSKTFLVGCFVMIVFLTYSSQTKNFLRGNVFPAIKACGSFVVHVCVCVSFVIAFNCVGPVLGDSFLRSDMSVKCFEGNHVSAMVLSGFLGVIWAFAAPAAVNWMGRRRQETHTDPRFKFLFGGFPLPSFLHNSDLRCNLDGYRDGCRWWQTAVMVRKLFIQCILVFVQDSVLQGMA
jgi:hypothetical protein